jgi:protein involved in polysaccharide export with SLBB domain
MKRMILFSAVVALTAPWGAQGQVPTAFDPGRVELTRDDLQRLLVQYDEALRSTAYSSRVMDQIRADADRIRDRLTDGDFRVGDAVVLSVQGEVNIPPEVPVEPGPQITLPLFGDISLEGVLRSEIEAHLTRELSKFVHDPVVRAQALMRLSIQGAVGTPGFFVVPADMLVTEALMMAGGPGRGSNLEKLRIDRGSDTLIEGEDLQLAILEGRTLDQLNLRAGDQIYLPEATRGGGFLRGFGRWALVLGTALVFGVRAARF